MGLGAMSGRKQEHARLIMVQTAQSHDFAFAGQSGDRKSVCHCLSECGQVWNHAMEFLRSPNMPAEARDHFVEDQDRPTLFA